MRRLLLIVLITLITSVEIDESTTEPFVEMDFLEDDEHKFTLNFDKSPSNLKVYLVNGTHACEASCNVGTETVCTVVGNSCQADKDNGKYKFYYAVRYNTNNTEILANGTYGDKANVTISINFSSFIRSFLFFLSFLIF